MFEFNKFRYFPATICLHSAALWNLSWIITKLKGEIFKEKSILTLWSLEVYLDLMRDTMAPRVYLPGFMDDHLAIQLLCDDLWIRS